MSDPLDELYDSFTDEVFRLETLQAYSVPEYDERLRAFLEGRPLPPSPAKDRWLQDVRRFRDRGRRVWRVHVYDRPLSDYLRYEFTVYAENIAAGEVVRVAERASRAELADLRRDFILFDGDTEHAAAVLFDYSPTGQLLGREVTHDPIGIERCRHQRNLAGAASVPLDEVTPAA